MKYLKTYQEINEERKFDEYDKYILKNLPKILFDKLISKILKSAPSLSMRWKELKQQTKGNWSYFTGPTTQIKDDLTPINIEDIPDTPLKRGLFPFFNNWNIYLSSEKSKGGNLNKNAPERLVYYISKDELKKGDTITSRRESSWEMNKKEKATENDPIFILAAKYDIDEFLHEDIKNDIEEIFTYDLEELGIEVKRIYTSIKNDKIILTLTSTPEIKLGLYRYYHYDLWLKALKHQYIISKKHPDIIHEVLNSSQRVLKILKDNLKQDWTFDIKSKLTTQYLDPFESELFKGVDTTTQNPSLKIKDDPNTLMSRLYAFEDKIKNSQANLTLSIEFNKVK
jgi:hypothetical protein